MKGGNVIGHPGNDDEQGEFDLSKTESPCIYMDGQGPYGG